MEKNDQLFIQLLYMLHTSAIQGLGKISDPIGKASRSLEYVSQTIDLMVMLKEKSKGNISESTERILEGMLSELRLSYMPVKGESKQENEVKGDAKKNQNAK